MDMIEKGRKRNIIWIVLGVVAVFGAVAFYIFFPSDRPIAFFGAFILGAVISFCFCHTGQREDPSEWESRYREEMLDALSKDADEVFLLLGRDGATVEYISANVEDLFGVPREKVQHDLHWLRQTAADGGNLVSPEELSSLQSGQRISREQEFIHWKSGERRWCRETVCRMSVRGKDAFIVLMADHTGEIQAREELQNALDEARAANRARSNFLSNMSHDIRTPMNAIIGFATLLSKDADNPEHVREYTKKISTSGQHLLGLINDVLDMSRIESGKTSLNIGEFSLPELLEELKAMLLPQAKAKHQSFEVHVKGDVPELLLGDRVRMNQVLMNLLSNGIKYTQDSGRVELTVYHMEETTPDFAHLRFVVRDNGAGMSEELIESLFDPFVREGATVVDQTQGPELGMAITKSIVELMGGKIDVQSQVNQGTVVVVEVELAIPRQAHDEKSWESHGISRIPETESLDDSKHLSSKRGVLEGMLFLVVEDIVLNAELLSAMLSVEGAKCEIAENGQVALEMFRSSEPGYYDVILMDVEMPVMNGYEATKAIRGCGHPDAEKIRIVAMTANAFLEDVQNALDAGMDAHVAKPVDMEVVKQTIQTLKIQR